MPNIIGSVDKGVGGLGLLNGNIVDATQHGALSITTRTLTHTSMVQSIASFSGNLNISIAPFVFSFFNGKSLIGVSVVG